MQSWHATLDSYQSSSIIYCSFLSCHDDEKDIYLDESFLPQKHIQEASWRAFLFEQTTEPNTTEQSRQSRRRLICEADDRSNHTNSRHNFSRLFSQISEAVITYDWTELGA